MTWAGLADLGVKARGGFYRIEQTIEGVVITAHRKGEPVESWTCATLGVANQLRQRLTDEGLTGFVEGAR
jgi:hypothetical protein